MTNVDLPSTFWGTGAFPKADWVSGDFSTTIGYEHLEALGVRFAKEDADAIASTFGRDAIVSLRSTTAGGGRPRDERWNDFMAELCAYVHEEGIPAGTGTAGSDKVIKTVQDRLTKRGKSTLERSTVQDVVNAVLRRLRAANQS